MHGSITSSPWVSVGVFVIGYVENCVGGRSGIGGNSCYSMNCIGRGMEKGVGRISFRDQRVKMGCRGRHGDAGGRDTLEINQPT